ncbi:MAG: hypothetical protein P4N59_21100 [Negativicutes bacterium]|nr:hypothetical protein [Negativicutes bacterium]
MRRRDRNKFFEFWEKPLFYAGVGSVILLLLAQALLLGEQSRQYLSWVDRLEGESISLSTPLTAGDPVKVTESFPVANPVDKERQHKTVTIRMLKPAEGREIFVTVNGTRMGDFRQGELALSVYEGDFLAIDASALTTPGIFRINTNSDGVIAPQDGSEVAGKAQILPVGEVKFTH